jgi:hypothetical protein
LTTFLFSSCNALYLAEAVTGGEPRTVRSQRPRCRFLLAFTRFSRPRYRFERATSGELPRRSYSGDRRARVRGPREGRVYCRAREARFRVSRVRCMRFEECMRTTFPSSASSGHPLSPVRRREGRRPVPDGGPNQDLRSDADPRRPTPSRRPGCLPPLRSAVSVRTRIAPNPNLPRRPLAHAAHTLSPGWGECLHGHCKHQSAVTRDPWHSRNKRLCYRWVRSFRICRAWD